MLRKPILAIFLFLSLSFTLTTRAQAYENPMFGYTHLLPSPYTLSAGRLILGTDVAYGLTDFFQVGTSLISDLYQIYNANAKLSLLDYPSFAMAITFSWQSFNYKNLYSSNPDYQVTSYGPGVVTAYGLFDTLALFIGGNLLFSDKTLTVQGAKFSGLAKGATFESDLSWGYNPKKKSVGPVLSGGLSYDTTYSMVGVGISHHWPGFHLGFHYYPSASEHKLVPIISGGASFDL